MSIQVITDHIKNLEFLFNDYQKNFWMTIKTEPMKWLGRPPESEVEEFWIVGILGRHVIYYNDIEEGFNVSPYSTFGEILEYRSNQSELHELIAGLYESICQGERVLW